MRTCLAGLIIALFSAWPAPAQEAPPPVDGWTLLHEESFEQPLTAAADGAMGDWLCLWGDAAVRDGALRGPGTLCLLKRLPGNQRVEYDARSEKPECYLGAELCSPSVTGSTYEKCYFGFRVKAKDSRVYVRGRRILQFPSYEVGRTYRVICQIEDHQATMWVDGKKVFDAAYRPMLRDAKRPHILLDLGDGGAIDNLKVFTKPDGEAGREKAQALEAETWRSDLNFAPSDEYVSPHVPYGKPYARGPVRALIAAQACAARGAVELAQRIDLAMDFVAEGPNNLYWRQHPLAAYPGPACGERMAELLKRPHDVIVLGAVPFSAYPRFLRAEILKQVDGGVGLVISGDKPPTDRDGALFDLFNGARPAAGNFPGARAKVAERGKGRVAFVDLPGPSPNDGSLKLFTGYQERDVEEFCRTVLWAARKEPAITISAETLTGKIERDALAARPLAVKIGGLDPGAAARLVLTIRRDLDRQYPFLYGGMFYQFRPYASWQTLARVESPASAECALKLPALPSGASSFDFRIEDSKGRVLAWRNVPIAITDAAGIDEILIGRQPDRLFKANEELAPVCFAPSDSLHALVKTTGAEGRRLRLGLIDREDRLLAVDTRPVTGGTAAFTLPLAAACHRLAVARAELLDGEVVRAELRAPVGLAPMPERTPAFRMRLYGCSLLRPDHTAAGISYRVGYGLSMPQSLLQHAWHDLELGDFQAETLAPAKSLTGGLRDPSYSDPDFRRRQCDAIRKYLQPAAAFGFRLFLCDEWTYAYQRDQKMQWPELANQDTSEPAKADYRRWLEAQYKDIAALNAEWGTQHAAFAQVDPPVYDKDPAKAPAEDLWPQIVDHRAFVDQSVAGFLKELADAAHEVSPLNVVGTSGHYDAGMWTGRDNYLWATLAPNIVTYRNHVLWQSFTPDKVGWWMGYGAELRDPARESARAWEALFTGIEQAYWGREEPPFLPDFTLGKAPAQYFAAQREIRDSGIGDLLMASRDDNRIAILYHPPSAMIANLRAWQKGASPTATNRDADFLGKDVEALLPPGAYHYVHTAQLISGDFGRYANPALIWLPRTEVLGDDEAAALRKYVEEGGVLVADVNAGQRDAHGKLREKGALDDLFGLRRAGPCGAPVKGEAVVDFPDGPDLKAALVGATPFELAGARSLATLTAAGLTAPAFFLNTPGKGKAIFLNYLPADRVGVGPVLRLAGLPSGPRLRGDTPLLRASYAFARGGVVCHALVAQLTAETPAAAVTLSLPEARHLYDVRARRYLGQLQNVPVLLEHPFKQVRILAAFPYRVLPPRVEGLAPRCPPGAPVRFAAFMDGSETHTLRLRVYGPDGLERAAYARTAATRDHRAEFAFHLARNDAPGAWKTTVTDVATGVETTATFEVKPQ
jgi:hypothetical protein